MRRTSADSCGAGRGLPGSLGQHWAPEPGGGGWLCLPLPSSSRRGPGRLRPAAGPAAHPALLHPSPPPGSPRPTPAGLSLEIALTSLPCPPLPVGPGAPSLHPRLPCPVRNRPARSSREAASSAEWSHVVARAPRTGSGAHARARVVRGRMGGGDIEVGVPMGMHRGTDCWEDGEMNRINGR